VDPKNPVSVVYTKTCQRRFQRGFPVWLPPYQDIQGSRGMISRAFSAADGIFIPRYLRYPRPDYLPCCFPAQIGCQFIIYTGCLASLFRLHSQGKSRNPPYSFSRDGDFVDIIDVFTMSRVLAEVQSVQFSNTSRILIAKSFTEKGFWMK
jgi:hypothetical protein